MNLATKPAWCLGMLGTKNRQFGNIVGHVEGRGGMSSLSEWTNSQFDPTLDWESVEWIRKQWDGKLILKGINDVEDAKIAASTGAAPSSSPTMAAASSTGGGGSIDMLAPIVDAVGHQIEVHMDSGIRSGQDVFKAMALGAKSTFIGRAFVWGLGRGGREGRHEGASDHPQRAGHHDGPVRRDRHHEGRPAQSADAGWPANR